VRGVIEHVVPVAVPHPHQPVLADAHPAAREAEGGVEMFEPRARRAQVERMPSDPFRQDRHVAGVAEIFGGEHERVELHVRRRPGGRHHIAVAAIGGLAVTVGGVAFEDVAQRERASAGLVRASGSACWAMSRVQPVQPPAKIIGGAPHDDAVAEIVALHGERLDGGGVPARLAADLRVGFAR